MGLTGRNGGGLYGISLGRVFFGESMFSTQTDASKVAMVALAHRLKCADFALIDCQVESDHLFTMGAALITRQDFIQSLTNLVDTVSDSHPWDNRDKMLVRDLLL